MSETDSFIEEVTEEVRRDRLFAMMRKYAWLGIALVVLIVGGAALREWRQAQATSAAENAGDAMLAALDRDAPGDRAAALAAIDSDAPGPGMVAGLLQAAEEVAAGTPEAASDTLSAVADDPELSLIYRQIASFKALTVNAAALDPATRRMEFEALAVPGGPLRLLAEEQLALLDVEAGETDAAIARLSRVLQDAELSTGLRRRATQLIVALGGDVPGVPTAPAVQDGQ